MERYFCRRYVCMVRFWGLVMGSNCIVIKQFVFPIFGLEESLKVYVLFLNCKKRIRGYRWHLEIMLTLSPVIGRASPGGRGKNRLFLALANSRIYSIRYVDSVTPL